MNNKAGRNDPCPCGSGSKYKKCCALKTGMKRYSTSVITEKSHILPGSQAISQASSLLGRVSQGIANLGSASTKEEK